LAFAYLVAALRKRGHEPRVVDAAAPYGPRDPEAFLNAVAAHAPDVVGLHLKTLEAQPAYAAAQTLRGLGIPLIAGGPHATICLAETLRNGFDYAIRGEAEVALPDLIDALAAGSSVENIAGVSFVDRGLSRHAPSRPFEMDLDGLPQPLSALDAFEPAAYGASAPIAPAGLLSSRGCPAACTFCANNVTGRKFRFHSPERVAAEVRVLRDDFATPAFSFFDDSFAVGRVRVARLAAALEDVGGLGWTCTAHPSHLDPDVLLQLKRAGCGGVDMGIESGDSGMLTRIGKGVTTERVLDVLGWAADIGLHTVVNLMVGWPDETEAELEATLDFIEQAAPYAGGFNARGVLVPHPGTEIYDRYHERFGFSEWWLREAPLPYEPFPAQWSPAEVVRAYAVDPALERNFFDHTPARLGLMREVLEQKAHHTFRRVLGLQQGAAPTVMVPAAGAR
jgi:radical SAM superfamily enzyme YgiQ (UPF0313 family)